MPSRSGRSTGPSRRRTRANAPRVDVYLFPAVVGGGLGDIEEVLAAGRELARAGFPVQLFRRPVHPLPRSVDGPWDWPRLVRSDRPLRRAPAAISITPAWGLSAAPGSPGALGRPGPWAEEAAELERVYGERSTLHVSLEEFARTLTPAEEDRERLREGGVRHRQLGHRLRASRAAGERAALGIAFYRFRAFDRPNVLHVFASFRPRPAFARAFPAAVQTGPLWSRAFANGARRARREWVWYASPASAERILSDVALGLATRPDPPRLIVRTDRPWRGTELPRGVARVGGAVAASRWRRRFRDAEVRIVTGSRTLLEAIEVGGPFLYFNGVLGEGPARRRHRPEKLTELLALLRENGAPADLVRDLADFGRGRRVRAVVRRAAGREGGWARFPRRLRTGGFRAPYDDAGRLLVRVARALGRAPRTAPEIVARARAGDPL